MKAIKAIVACSLLVLLGSGCATMRMRAPEDQVLHDAQGREIKRASFNRDESLRRLITYDYLDSVVHVVDVEYESDGAYTEKETYHVWDTPVSLTKIRKFDAAGNLLEERNKLVPPSIPNLEHRRYNPFDAPKK